MVNKGLPHGFGKLKPLGLVFKEIQKKRVCLGWGQMHARGFPFVERIGSDARCGTYRLDGMPSHVDCGPKNGFGLRECGVLFHFLTSS